MKIFFTAVLIATTFIYIGASIYSSNFAPFHWIDKGGIMAIWAFGIFVSGALQCAYYIAKEEGK